MRYITLILLLIISIILQAQGIKQKQLDSFLMQESIKHSAVSICVIDINTDSILLSTTPQLCVVPASVQKLITSAAAIQLLGGNTKFKTTLWTDGKIENNALIGNLIITGGGDPTLGSEHFAKKEGQKRFLSEWVYHIKKAGIDTVLGDIIADPFIFSDQDVPNSWLWEDIGNYFGAAASGISIYDNIFEIAFNVPKTEGMLSEIVRITPEIPFLTLENEVVSSAQNADETCVYGSPFNASRKIKGTLPAGAVNYAVKASVPDPALLLASELKKVLADSSVFVSGGIKKQKVAAQDKVDSSKIFICWDSPCLSEIVDYLNKESINLYAETLLKHIGLTTYNVGSTEAGTKAVKEFWTRNGIDTQNLFLVDGSGLSRANAITAKTLVDILVFMKTKSKWFDTFLTSIPLTGVEGTQKYYFQDSFLKGKAHAKTGSMTRVRSMAGYMTTKNDKEIAFAIIINNYNNSSSVIKNQLEKLLEKIYLEI